jgi:hypothetical protein
MLKISPRFFILVLFLLFGMAYGQAPAHEHLHGNAEAQKDIAPPGFEKVDVVIELGTRHGDIRFDKESLYVEPGQKVKIIFLSLIKFFGVYQW